MADILRQRKRSGPVVPLFATTLAGLEALEALDEADPAVLAKMTRKALLHADHADDILADLVRDHGVEIDEVWTL